MGDRMRLGYRWAPAERPGTTVLLLHGLGADSAQLWDHVDPAPGVSVLAPDARLHGDSSGEPSVPLSFGLLAADALSLVDRLRPGDRLIVVGVSMGAGVAARIALSVPDRVDALVAIRPAWLDRPHPPHLAVLERAGVLLGSDLPAAALEEQLRATPEFRKVERVSAAAAASALGQLTAPHARARARRLREMPADAPVPELGQLATIDVPSLVVEAHDDPVHPASIARIWAELLPASRLDVLPSRDTHPESYRDRLRSLVNGFVSTR
jgi:pimeloyl-ACP methyl ester carboxylesterase